MNSTLVAFSAAYAGVAIYFLAQLLPRILKDEEYADERALAFMLSIGMSLLWPVSLAFVFAMVLFATPKAPR